MDSHLRRRINLLSASERKTVLRQTHSLFQQCHTLNTDDFSIIDEKNLCAENENKQELTVETILSIVNEYHNCGKSIPDIMDEKKLTAFEVIMALAEYIFKQQETLSRLIDFTGVIRFMYAEQMSVIELINLMLLKPDLLLADVIIELLCLPSLCLLWLTLIWIELKNPKMANLFDMNWDKLVYHEFSASEFRTLDHEIQSIFNTYRQDVTNLEITPDDQLKEHLQMLKEVVEDRSKVINDTLKNVKELDQIINKRPSLEVETVLSDSSDSEPDNTGNDEICVLMQKVTGKWLQTDLTHEILTEEIQIEKLNFYFTKSLNQVDNNKKPIETFLMCKMLDIKDQNVFTMQFLLATNAVCDVRRSDLAMGKAPGVRCPEGTRIIALYQPKKLSKPGDGQTSGSTNTNSNGRWLAGTVGAKPLMQNRFEYLIFFDDGTDCYIPPENVRLMMEQPMDPTTNRFQPRLAHMLIKNPMKQNFIRKYLHIFPDFPLIRLKKSENTMRVLARRDGREESAFVLDVDRQMCLLRFPVLRAGPAGRTGRDCVALNCVEHEHFDEWIYRGNSDRFPTLQSSVAPSSGTTASRRIGRNRSRFEIALPEYDRNLQSTDEFNTNNVSESALKTKTMQTARKSGKRQILELENNLNIQSGPTSDLVTRRKLSNKFKETHLFALDWRDILPYQPHVKCSSKCINHLKITEKLEDYLPCSPYFIPLINGWMRELCRIKTSGRNESVRVIVVYRTPCGIRLLKIEDIAKYLQVTSTENLTIDLFTFDVNIRPTVIVKPHKREYVLCEDFAKGLEDVKIPVVNAVDKEKMPSMTYRARRFADSSIIDGSVQPQFCSGCSCLDNCSDPTKCECQQLTIISHDRLSASLRANGLTTYKYRSLSDKVISGIYECNDMCSCSKKLCYNRVVQQNIKIPLQLYMTAETGWGVRTLVDIPAGSFICTYSGRLLTDRMAELQGREVSDMYLAELDLHEVVESEKQQQGIDLIDDDEGIATGDESDLVSLGVNKNESGAFKSPVKEEVSAIDEEIQAHYDDGDKVECSNLNLTNQEAFFLIFLEAVKGLVATTSRQRPKTTHFNFETYFGDNALFIVDAQESGNIGRFLNHSCEPNVFVQMVLVDTHDLRLPWVAFFAETFVKAGEELRWNYGYSPNSVPGKVLICKCESQHCQGRLL